MAKKRVIHYLNQFFGQIGGEDMAHIEPQYHEEAIGPAQALGAAVAEDAEVIGTIICGDNFFGQSVEEARAFIQKVL